MKYGKLKLLFTLCFVILSSLSAQAATWKLLKHNNNSYVTLKNLKEFYRFPVMEKKNGKIVVRNQAVKLEFKPNSHECFINGIKFILAKPITSYSSSQLIAKLDIDKLIDPILRPVNSHGNNLFNVVIIDAGHGGSDPGAVNKLGTEAQYNLLVAKSLASMLQRSGYKVVMTRTDNRFLSLEQRAQIANKYSDAIFISIHFNAEARKQARGIETFTLSPSGVSHYGSRLKSSDKIEKTGNARDSQNIALATAVHGSVIEKIYQNGIRYDRGIKRARFSVLTNIKHPKILVEGGFMSHPDEARAINSTRYLNNITLGILEGIKRYHKAMSRSGRTK
ncbi:N-acetylmuramoyl-L-alanine amidase [Akkermansiaceae bacterium]|nr:N-acetylmuramoyl-L-alanine amidase [Akkermansiaceae bacterium]